MTQEIVYTNENHPFSKTYNGHDYYRTGKTGKRFKDDIQGREYSAKYTDPKLGEVEARLWIYEDGSFAED